MQTRYDTVAKFNGTPAVQIKRNANAIKRERTGKAKTKEKKILDTAQEAMIR